MLIEAFAEQVRQTQDNIAVKTEKRTYSYRELNNYANRIARLIEKNRLEKISSGHICIGVGTVGLLLDHGIDMIAAILGTLKSGMAYVPISPAYPPNRIFYMLSHSESIMVITRAKYEPGLKEWVRENNQCCINIESAGEEEDEGIPGTDPVTYPSYTSYPSQPSPHFPQREINGERLAYIMYTSGSTGKPKGVMQNHQNVMYYIKNWTQRFAISAADRMTLFSSFCHDGSVQDMFAALLNGAALYPFDVRTRETNIKLSRFLLEEKITIWHSVPSLYNFFVSTLTGEERFDDLRFILLGGEPLREYEIDMCKKFFPKSILANVYGQTESSVNSIWLIHPGESFTGLNIGEPLDNTGLFVVDEKGDEADVLKTGEILVASASISPGYWKDEDASAQVFDDDPEFGRLYWTGDLGRVLPDGSIEFAGRKDFQVKIRGFRVELGEIENHLLKHEAVKEAVVIAREEQNRGNVLYAYITTGKKSGITGLREYSGKELPDYMIPSYFIHLDHMPLTGSGKIDRKALAALEKNHLTLKRTYVKPAADLEKIIAHTWKEVLNLDEVSVYDNFFDLGGNSFDILKVQDLLEKAVNREIVVAKMFAYPTIRTLALYLQEKKNQEKPAGKNVSQPQYETINRVRDRLTQRTRMRRGAGTWK